MDLKCKIYNTNYVIYVNYRGKEGEIFNDSIIEYADYCDSVEEFEEALEEEITEELQNTGKFTNAEIQEIMQSEKMGDIINKIANSARNW